MDGDYPIYTQQEYRNPDGCLTTILGAIAVIVTLVLVLIASGCRSQATETTSKHSAYFNDKAITYIHDTTYTDRWHLVLQKGDTVYKIDSVIKYIAKYVHDTLRIEHIDTIYSTTTETITKPQPLSGWQRFIQTSGYVAWGALIIGIVLLIAKIFL